MATIDIHEDAQHDLDVILQYMDENADYRLTDRFLERVTETFELLAQFPHLGSPVGSPIGQRLRKFPIKDFNEYLLFYATPDDLVVVVLRVLNTSQAWYKELGIGLDSDEPEN